LTQPEVAAAGPDRSVLTEISNEIVRVFKNQFGRGPTSAEPPGQGRTR
jgi:hypothetical protein